MTEERREGQSQRSISGRTVARNSIFNFAGQGLGIVVALVTVPLLIHGLGTARFGVLTLVWVVIGYTGLFDLGMGRAVTALTSQRLGAGREHEVPTLFWTAVALLATLGVIAALVVAGTAHVLVHHLHIPERYQGEALTGFYLLAISVPCVVSSNALRGTLEAHQRFDLTNKIIVPIQLLTYIGPAIVVQFSSSLVPVVGAVVASRLIAWLVNFQLVVRTTPGLLQNIAVRRSEVGPLLRFGGWVTISNIVGPLMMTATRLLVGLILSVTAVAYFATPYDMVTKLWIISFSLSGVLFPALAYTRAADSGQLARLFSLGTRTIFVAMFPIALAVVVLSHEGLQLWLGSEFARHSEAVLEWLAVGVFANSMVQIPFALVSGTRPDLTAKIEMAELPVYIGVFYVLTKQFGIEGAAATWALRQAIDAVIQYWVAWRVTPSLGRPIREVSLSAGVGVAALVLAGRIEAPAAKYAFFAVALAVFAWVAWTRMLRANEREVLAARLRRLRSGGGGGEGRGEMVQQT